MWSYGPAAVLGPSLKYADLMGNAHLVARNLVERPSNWQAPGQPDGSTRLVHPGDPERSALLLRMRSRSPSSQMPPLGTVVRDQRAVDAITREPRSTRWIRALSYMKDTNRNGYARPIEGVVAVVNMNTRQVDRVIDLGVYPVPPQHGDLHEAAIGPQRIAPKPLNHVQPLGPKLYDLRPGSALADRVVHLRANTHSPAGRMAGDERDEGGFQARAGGFLLEEPGARRAATAPIAFARTSSGITPTSA